MRPWLSVILVASAACGGDQHDDSAVDVDVATTTGEVIQPDARDGETTVPPTKPASEYCESIAESFCDFYLRCGRMAVPNGAADRCREVFLETCNARYEPLWIALAERGAVVLSTDGIAACGAHLRTVQCDQQILDLDGPCRSLWRGQIGVRGACGLGLESFVCAPDTTCVIDLDLCGVCVARAKAGETCDLEHRCADTEVCRDGACRARKRPGEACDEGVGCVLGAACVDGLCRGPDVVTIGAPCDADRRCPYKSACVAGTCRETGLLGDACEPAVGCASGFCATEACVPLVDEGEVCSRPDACVSGRCTGARCDAVTFSCLD